VRQWSSHGTATPRARRDTLPPIRPRATAESIHDARVYELVQGYPVETVQPATAETAPTIEGNEQ
jgi:hypothetical protein